MPAEMVNIEIPEGFRIAKGKQPRFIKGDEYYLRDGEAAKWRGSGSSYSYIALEKIIPESKYPFFKVTGQLVVTATPDFPDGRYIHESALKQALHLIDIDKDDDWRPLHDVQHRELLECLKCIES